MTTVKVYKHDAPYLALVTKYDMSMAEPFLTSFNEDLRETKR